MSAAADPDFITKRVFPGEFANVTYDAATCTTAPLLVGNGGASSTGTSDAPSEADGAGQAGQSAL